MYRATTPRHTFMFDNDPAENYKTILITYAQNGRIILEKNRNDLSTAIPDTIDGRAVYSTYLQLSQEESRRFSPSVNIKVQIRALTYNDEALASKQMTIPINDVLNDEVLT